MLCFPMFSPTDVFDDRGVGSLSRKTIGRSTLGPMAHDYDETDLGSLVEAPGGFGLEGTHISSTGLEAMMGLSMWLWPPSYSRGWLRSFNIVQT